MNSATWPLRTVAQAANMKPRALRQWFDTDVMKLRGNDKKSSGSGDHCGLSRRRAYQAAITQTLNKCRVSVSHAARAALEFTDVGNIGRAPGELFEHGTTLLVIRPDGTTVENVFHDTPWTEISNPGTCAIVVVNRVVEQVDTVLNTIS
jgi:hypothetical protein